MTPARARGAYGSPSTASSIAPISTGHWITLPSLWAIAVSGSFSPRPVRTQATWPAPSAPYFEQPGDRGGGGRLAEHAFPGPEQPVGGQYLSVARRP